MRDLTKLVLLFSVMTQNSYAQEVKFGIMQHDFNTKLGHRIERGKNIIVEYWFDKMQNYLRAYPHIGASINNAGFTSNIYAGITWQFEVKQFLLLEASFGASVNNAEKKNKKKRRALGSNFLFRESFSVGYIINETNSISIIIDHTSNAGLATPNPGLTDIGIRYGYKF
jgi:lipid A 3-O-deacylase